MSKAQQVVLQDREDKMGTEPVLKLLISMSLPAMVSMLVQALYNVIDSIYVSQIGEEALAAVSLAFPIQILIVALSVGMGVGINSCISRRLGQDRLQDAVYIAEHGLILSVIISIALVLIGMLGITPYLRLFAPEGPTLSMAIGYSDIVTYLAFGSVLCQAGFSILQGSGNMIQPMIGQLIGAITNLILDPFFIFGWFGLPRLGVNGAAIATVIGQILGMIYILLIVFFRKKNLIKIDFRKFKYKNAIMKDIITVGLPACIMQGVGSIMLSGYNFLLANFGTTALAVFGVYFKVQSFIFMPIFGLGQGSMPIFGFNYGARNEKRFMETMKYAIIISVCIMLIGLAWFELAPQSILMIFNSSEQMLQMGSTAFRIIALSFPIAGVCIVISNSFQAMGKSYISMIASFLRQLVILLPAAYLFAYIGGLDLNWLSFLVAEFASFLYLLNRFLHYKHTELDKFPKMKEVVNNG